MTTRLESEKLREEIYTLHLRGASRNEIAETLGIPRSVAHYHIAQMRLKNDRWFRENSDIEQFMQGWVKELWDRHLQAYRETWRLYEAVDVTGEKDIRLKAVLLRQAQECLDKLRRLYSSITKSIQGYDFYPRRTRQDSLRVRHPSFPRSSPVSTFFPLFPIWSNVESWPAKNQDPPILSRTLPEQPQNDEIQDLKCPTFSPTHPVVTRSPDRFSASFRLRTSTSKNTYIHLPYSKKWTIRVLPSWLTKL